MKNLAQLIDRLINRKKEYEDLTAEEIENRKKAFIKDDKLQRKSYEDILQAYADTITELEDEGEIEKGSVTLAGRRKSFDSTVRNEQMVRRKNRTLLRLIIAELESLQESMEEGDYVGNYENEIKNIMGKLYEINKATDDSWGIKIVSKDTYDLRKVRKRMSQKLPLKFVKQTKHAQSKKSHPDYDGLHQVMFIVGNETSPMIELQSRSEETEYECTFGKLSHTRYVARKEGEQSNSRIEKIEDILRKGEEEPPINLPRVYSKRGKTIQQTEIETVIMENFEISKERIAELRQEKMKNHTEIERDT